MNGSVINAIDAFEFASDRSNGTVCLVVLFHHGSGFGVGDAVADGGVKHGVVKRDNGAFALIIGDDVLQNGAEGADFFAMNQKGTDSFEVEPPAHFAEKFEEVGERHCKPDRRIVGVGTGDQDIIFAEEAAPTA